MRKGGLPSNTATCGYPDELDVLCTVQGLTLKAAICTSPRSHLADAAIRLR